MGVGRRLVWEKGRVVWRGALVAGEKSGGAPKMSVLFDPG